MPDTNQLKRALLTKRERPVLSRESAVSSGSTLLNLSCTDQSDVCFMKGGYYYLVGDSTSGKTWLSMSFFAEACANKAFKDYRLIFDNVEGGALMDISYYFGKEVAKRLESPKMEEGLPVCSDTVESFYYNITTALKKGKPFIYVLDSQDSLTSDQSKKKFNQHKKADSTGEEAAGSYGDGKAKYHSENIRHVLAGLRKTGSILIIIGQTRDNLGFGFEKKTRSGGKALRFYANLEIWTSLALKLKKTVRDKERTVGVNCLAEVKKNRMTGKVGKDRAVTIPIYYDLGIDDIGSCVDFLIAEKHWGLVRGAESTGRRKGGRIDAHDIMIEGSRKQIIAYIEEEDLEEKVRQITAKVWAEIEEACKPNRKKRYE